MVDVLHEDPFSSQVFCFCNRGRDKLTILFDHTNGFWLWYRRLERQRFWWPPTDTPGPVALSLRELHWLLDGLDPQRVAARALGIEHMAAHGVQGRGVLVDLFSHCGEHPRREVGYDDLMRILDTDQVVIESGDILCFWTGLDQLILRMRGQPDDRIKIACAVLDGWDPRLRQWITDSAIAAIAAIAADNLAVEAVGKPLPDGYLGSSLPLHEHCLFKLGVHLGELWYLADLARWLRAHGRSRFLLTAAPLRLTGAVGSPVTPVATV